MLDKSRNKLTSFSFCPWNDSLFTGDLVPSTSLSLYCSNTFIIAQSSHYMNLEFAICILRCVGVYFCGIKNARLGSGLCSWWVKVWLKHGWDGTINQLQSNMYMV